MIVVGGNIMRASSIRQVVKKTGNSGVKIPLILISWLRDRTRSTGSWNAGVRCRANSDHLKCWAPTAETLLGVNEYV